MNAEEIATTGAHILIVDDAVENLRLLSRILEREGYSISAVTDGESALALIHHERPDLILLDIRMPGMDGFEVCRRLKQDGAISDIPIVFISALHAVEDKLKGFQSGGADYITKPFQKEELLARVDQQVQLVRFRKILEIQAERHLDMFFELAPDLLVIANNQGFFCRLSHAWEEVLGFSRQELCRVPFIQFVHPDDRVATFDKLEMQRQGRVVNQFTNRYRCKNGGYRWLEWTSSAAKDELIYAVARDVTERRKLEADLKLAASVYHNTVEAILVTDDTPSIISVNRAFSEITGYQPEEVVGKNPNLLRSGHTSPECYEQLWRDLVAEGRWQGEIWNRRKNGEPYLAHQTIVAVEDEAHERRYLAVQRDITDQRKQEEHIRNLAYRDALTGLANRTLILDRLRKGILRAQRDRTVLALLFIDLDRFKEVNDILGHDAGDDLLQTVAERLVRTVRVSDTVARLGGDEFVILMEQAGSAEGVAATAGKICEVIAQPLVLKKQSVQLTSSIGITLYPHDAEEGGELMKRADAAMYSAKSDGRNAYRFFDEEMMRSAEARMAMLQKLREAIDKDNFKVVYQPQIRLRDRRVRGVELLLRMQDEKGGLISPDDFIPLAEESGLIAGISQFVLEHAVRLLHQWQDGAFGKLVVAINLSAKYLDASLPQQIQALCNEYQVHPSRLEVEITESSIMGDPVAAVRILNCLREMKVSVAMDDFGTGYSSLAQLQHMPLDIIKIDRSFVEKAKRSEQGHAILKMMLSLANTLGLDAIAEGVEQSSCLEMLEKENCAIVQGYYFARPMTLHDLHEWMERRSGQGA